MTVLMSGSPTLSLVIPMHYTVTAHSKAAVSTTKGFRSTQTINFAKSVIKKLEDYDGMVENKITSMASALDPRVTYYLSSLRILQTRIDEEINMEFELSYESIFNEECDQASSEPASSQQGFNSGNFIGYELADAGPAGHQRPTNVTQRVI